MPKDTDIDTQKKKGVISLIAALGENRAIGKGGALLWHIPDDMRRFKEITAGHPVIMGRKTWESLPEKFRPLPGRTNIVVTRQARYPASGAIVAASVEAARAQASRSPGGDEIFIIGGGELYAAALPSAHRLYLTLIDDAKEGDIFFPSYETEFTKILSDESREWNELRYRWLTLARG